MATINLRFYRKTSAPENPKEGYIWFNPTAKRIQLYKNSAWEDYSGEVLDASYANNVLTITKRGGSVVTVNLSDIAKISGLESDVNAVEEAIGDINTQLETIDTNYKTVAGNITSLQSAVNGVDGKITNAVNGLNATVHSVGSGKTFDVDDMSGHVAVEVVETSGKLTSVSVLEKDIASASTLSTLSNTVSDLGDAVDVLTGSDTGKSVRSIANEELAAILITGAENGAEDNFKTLKELADWLEKHPEDAAAMNSEITALKNSVSALQTGTVTSFGGKTGAITVRGGLAGNGSVNLTMSNNQLQASIVGLGSAAYTASTAYATAAQGTLATSALQQITSGNTTYLTVSNKSNDANKNQSITPVIGTYNGSNGLATTSATTTYVESVFAWAEF